MSLKEWYPAKAQVRIRKATFDFENNTWSVEGWLDFLGPEGNEHLICTSTPTFTKSFFGFDAANDALEDLLKKVVGKDLFEEKAK